MSKKYRVGVIGAGARGETFARQLYAGSSRYELFGVCDIDGDRLEKFCQHCQLPKARQFTDTAAFVQEPGLDAVIITTPEFTHRAVAEAAMAAGKHVYCEKAIAATAEDGRAIIRAHRKSRGVIAFLGFNLRVQRPWLKLKEIVASGVLGQLVHVAGLEQMSTDHGASFTRRFHRHSARSGGLLNTKASHDLDYIQWLVGEEHKVTHVASFGGINVLKPEKRPPGVTHCSHCPPAIRDDCRFQDRPGFIFPVRAAAPTQIYKTQEKEIYGGDLCAFNDDKDIVDNQTVIWQWDNGVRGNFNLQMFQHVGRRETTVWGENGFAELSERGYAEGVPAKNMRPTVVRLVDGRSGDTSTWRFPTEAGGHGGSDPKMIAQFLDCIERNEQSSSGLSAGLAATILATKADEARRLGQTIVIDPAEYL